MKKLLATLAIMPLRVYQLAVSPWLPMNCRFQPSCSHYAIKAIRLHGVAKGAWLTIRRLARCHPWGGEGFDPVPGCAVDAETEKCFFSQDDTNNPHNHR